MARTSAAVQLWQALHNQPTRLFWDINVTTSEWYEKPTRNSNLINWRSIITKNNIIYIHAAKTYIEYTRGVETNSYLEGQVFSSIL